MKRRLFASGIVLMLIFTLFPCAVYAADTWDGSVDTSWYDSGETSFTLTTAEALAGFARLVNEGAAESGNTPVDFYGCTITLGDDVILSGHQWTPIGIFDWSSGVPFEGTFDGGGHVVSGLTIGTSGSPESTIDGVGLFGFAGENSLIEHLDVQIDGIYTSNEDAYAGGIAGVSYGDLSDCTVSGNVTGSNGAVAGLLAGLAQGSITGCSTSGSVVSDSYAGGLLGSCWGGISITGSHSSATVAGGTDAGGFIAYCNLGSGTISNCYATGDVTTNGNYACTGGFVGSHNLDSSILNCYALGDVTATGTEPYAGGFVGYGDEDYEGTISGCYAMGDVDAGDWAYVGGFAGYLDGTDFTLSASFAYGDVTGGSGNGAGGLAGYANCNVSNCFACGDVAAGMNSSVGGLIGYNADEVFNCYAAGSASGGSGGNCAVGGFAGYNSYYVQHCYARGAVSGGGTGNYIGGFAGYNEGSVIECYFDKQGTGQAEDFGYDFWGDTATALTAAEMTGAAASVNMDTFNFTAIWQQKDNGNSQWYFPQLDAFSGSSDSMIQSVSLESVTLDLFKVSFDTGGGSAVADKYGYYSAVAEPTDPTLSGYVFGGWYTDEDCTTAYDFSTLVTADTTLHAKWTELTLESDDADGTIYVGGRVTLTPSVDGGEWDWDEEYLSATFNSPATFTALKAGTSTITYTVDGVSVTYDVTIEQSGLPSTGQDFTWVWVLIGAALVLAGAGVFARRRISAARER